MTREYYEDGQCACVVCFAKKHIWCNCLAHGPWPCGHCQKHREYAKLYKSLGLVSTSVILSGKGPRTMNSEVRNSLAKTMSEAIGVGSNGRVAEEGTHKNPSLGPPETLVKETKQE